MKRRSEPDLYFIRTATTMRENQAMLRSSSSQVRAENWLVSMAQSCYVFRVKWTEQIVPHNNV